ncbi:MAG: hypothetical protein WA919_03945 [Coleofasciculaceae cyanobacterium]
MLKVCLQQSWPQDKPIAKFIFPRILPTSFGNVVTLWVILPEQEIRKHLFSKLYKQFLFIDSPSPMLLWINRIYSEERTTEYLPCYLDLQKQKSQEIVQQMSQAGYYRLLLFSTQQPQSCNQVITVTLNPELCQTLQNWVTLSQRSKSQMSSSLSKFCLKTEFEKLKHHSLAQLS